MRNPPDAQAVLDRLDRQFAEAEAKQLPKLRNSPRETSGQPRNQWIHVRVSEREKSRFTKKAHEYGYTLAAFTLQVLHRTRFRPRLLSGKFARPIEEELK